MNKIRNYIGAIILVTGMVLTFMYGIASLFSSLQIFLESVLALIILYILGIGVLKNEKSSSSYIKGGVMWRLRKNPKNRAFAIILLSIIQLGILGFAFSPAGPGYKKVIALAIIIPWLLSSSLLMKEKVGE